MSKKTEPEIKLETITPQRAQADLEKAEGKNYRRLNEQRAVNIAQAIIHGDWELNGETVKYNCDGKLIDGQTRFRAIVIADKPVQSFVAYGVTSDRNIDTGSPRRFEDLLKKMGETNAKDLSGALSWVWRKNNLGWDCCSQTFIPHSEKLRLLKKEPALRECVAIVGSLVPSTIGMHAMLSAFMLFASAKDSELARWFIEKLGSGVELKEDEPVRRLRERLEEDRSRKARLTTKEKSALVIIAWNMTRQGKPAKVLRWTSNGPTAQPYPDIE